MPLVFVNRKQTSQSSSHSQSRNNQHPDIQHKMSHPSQKPALPCETRNHKPALPCKASLKSTIPAITTCTASIDTDITDTDITTTPVTHTKVQVIPASIHFKTEASLKASQREVQKLQGTVKAQYSQITELHTKLREYEQNPCTHHDLQRTQTQYDTLSKTFGQVSAENDRLSKRVSQVSTENDKLKQENSKYKDLLASLQKHVDTSLSLHKSVSQLQQDHHRCQAELGDTSKKYLQCQTQLQDKTKQWTQLQHKLKDITAENTKLSQTIKDITAGNTKLSQTIKDITAQNTQLSQTIKDLQTKLSTVTGEHSQIAKSLQEEINSLHSSLQTSAKRANHIATGINPEDLQTALHIAHAQKTQLVEQSIALENAHDLLHLASKYILTTKGSDPSVAQELMNSRDLLGSMLVKYH